MLKFYSVGMDGKTSLWIGLSQRNLDRLPEDPIMFDLAELDDDRRPDRVVIVGGPTEGAIAERLRALGLPLPEVPDLGPGERFETRG